MHGPHTQRGRIANCVDFSEAKVSRGCVTYLRMGGFTVRRGTLPAGDRGTKRTLDVMRALAIEGSKQLEVRDAAVAALHVYQAREHDHLSQLGAIFRFVRDRIMFVNDMLGVEMLQGPRKTLEARAGDCDDRAVLMVAMARSVGIPADLRFKVIGADRSRPGRFSHVYVTAHIRGKSIAMDPTYRTNQLGTEYRYPSRAAEVPA
jgi:transglutaminase-like putative cysteine protease